MAQYIFANNVNTSLFAPITSTATSLTLLSATNLPTLAAGQIMPLTLNDKATRTIFEIVYVTAISGTNLTVIRGQEGTAAQNWNAGDYAFSTQTAQTTEIAIQSGAYNYATDTGTTANAYIVSLTPAIPTTIPDGFPLTMYVTPARANTGAATLNGVAILDGNGQPILAGQLKNSCALRYNAGLTAWQFLGARQSVSVLDFGADPTGVADSTAAIQAAINTVQGTIIQLHVPAGLYKLTSPLVATLPIHIVGIGAEWNGTPGTINAASVQGTVFWLDHLGKGFEFTESGIGYTKLENFGTIRNQVAPASGWTPIAADYDIYAAYTSNVYIDGIFLINPTNGIQFYNMGYGKPNIRNLRLQAFQVGVNMDGIYDTAYVDRVHQWPFWSNDSYTQAYTLSNLASWQFFRVDNPMFSNVFSIFHNRGIQFSQSSLGATSKIHATNVDLDLGTIGIIVDTSVKSGVTGQFENLTIQGSGNTGITTLGITVEGNSCNIDFGELAITSVGSNGVRVYGSSNVLRFGNLSVNSFDTVSSGFPGVEVGAGNSVYIANYPTLITGGTGLKYSINTYGSTAYGVISTPDWQTAYIPAVTSTSGTLTTATGTMQYKLHNKTVSYAAQLTITTVGTGAGGIAFTLPITANYVTVGCGRDSTISGKSLTCTANGSTAYVYNYDDSFPASDGSVLIVTGEYPIA